MSHEEERDKSARAENEHERAPPHWLNPLVKLGLSLRSFFTSFHRLRSVCRTRMDPAKKLYLVVSNSTWQFVSLSLVTEIQV
jgi:hypothetical protein